MAIQNASIKDSDQTAVTAQAVLNLSGCTYPKTSVLKLRLLLSLQHQLFNMNEKNPSSDYWHQRNFGERVVDMMKDAERVLRSGKLPNYFNTGDNLLAGKDRTVLNRLADYIRTEREKLLHIM